jgi:hypothetical protein
MKRQMKSSEGRHQAIEYAPRLTELTLQYKRLNSREAQVAFIDTWLRTWAYDFEKTWPVIYQALEWVEQDELYKDPRAMNPDEIYPDFKSYFEARLKKPFTMWMELEQTHHYVSRYAPELIDKTWGDVRAKAAEHYRKVDETDQIAKTQQPHGGAREGAGRPPKQENFKFNTTTNDVKLEKKTEAPMGNSEAYAMRKLREDAPAIHARVLAGELSANAGMIEACFRTKRASRKLTPLDQLRRWWQKASEDERTIFRGEIQD